jgi:hypothetical protein
MGFRPVLLSCGAYPDQPPRYPFADEKTRTMMPITATVVNPIVATIDISIQYLPYMIIVIVRTGTKDLHDRD